VSLTQEAIFAIADLSAYDVQPETVRQIPYALSQRYDVLSLAADASEITVGFADAPRPEVVERIRLATGKHVRPVRVPRDVIRRRMRAVYPLENGECETHGVREESPVVRMLERILEDAVRARASDVHLEPARGAGRVRLRIDGMLQEVRPLPADIFTPLISCVKLLAGMDIAEKRRPQDGRYLAHAASLTEARVSSMPTPGGEKIVLRLMGGEGAIPRLGELGMRGALLEAVAETLARKHGLFVVCGPTGSGKTTTLYSAILHQACGERNICSVEDPIEVRLSGITQTEVNERAGFTFEAALRGFLRQDPDVLVVGEMRDPQTAKAAIGAAQTGRLVLTSLHAAHGAGALERLQQLGIDERVAREALAGILTQRLIRLRRRDRVGGRTGIFAFESSIRTAALTLDELRADGAFKVAAGITTAEEVMAAVQAGAA